MVSPMLGPPVPDEDGRVSHAIANAEVLEGAFALNDPLRNKRRVEFQADIRPFRAVPLVELDQCASRLPMAPISRSRSSRTYQPTLKGR